MYRIAPKPDDLSREALLQGVSMDDLRAEAGRIRDREMQELNYGMMPAPHGAVEKASARRRALGGVPSSDGQQEGRSTNALASASRPIPEVVSSSVGSTESPSRQGREEDEEEIDEEDFKRWLEANRSAADGEARWAEEIGDKAKKRPWEATLVVS